VVKLINDEISSIYQIPYPTYHFKNNKPSTNKIEKKTQKFKSIKIISHIDVWRQIFFFIAVCVFEEVGGGEEDIG
jgi:hypothetical protein